MSDLLPYDKYPICIMTCKCRIPFSELIQYGNKKICPNHKKGRIVEKEFICTKCGKVFKASKLASNSLYCQLCRAEETIEKNRRAKSKDKKKKVSDQEYIDASVEMAFCKNRSVCSGKHTGKYIPCLECEHFRDKSMINSL